MRIRRVVLVALFAMLVVPFARDFTPAARAAESIPYVVASETYYTVDAANGRISVKIHGEYQNMQSKDLAELPVWVMPGAENIVVKAGDSRLESTLIPGDEATATAGFALATLPAPLKQKTRIQLDATYDIPPRTGGAMMTLEPGLIETPFIGQGPGSFVLVDVPKDGDNYFDPGCLVAASQPSDVKDAGRVRWVCGEVLVIAVNGDDPDILKRCAAMDDKCRQRTDIRVFSAYMQSITDPSKSGKLEADVAMPDARTVHLALKYFKRDQAWADKQWPIAQKAFPMLETLFGFPYPGKSVVMRQSHHIENAGFGGLALNQEVLLTTNSGFDEEVTVHELAHMWASFNLETKWLWEGLAEYGMRSLAAELGITPLDRGWKAMPYTDPLSTWYNGSSVTNPDYWYGKAGAFFLEYETAIGGRANMTTVLGRMDDEPGLLPLDAGWFMDQGEWVSGKNLDALFTEWVFNPVSSKGLLADRRAAHDSVKALQERAAGMGLLGMPSDIYDNLLAWAFDPIAGQVDKANQVLDSYADVIAKSEAAGLGRPEGVGKSWGNKKISETLVVVEEQRQAILAILSAGEQLADAAPDSTAARKLAEARELYGAGDYAGAKAAASNGVTSAFNEVAALKMIEIAKQKQSTFSAGFFGRFGLMFSDPAGDLRRAEEALQAGDGTRALELSRGAYETWDGASERGMQRLAIGAGLMCGLAFLVWFLLKKIDGTPSTPKRLGQGHFIDQSEDRRSSWKDWENTP